jgi:N-acetyl-alpha-D-glucosaminyl L-malate synthase BshA
MKIGIICHSSYGGSARIAIDSALELSLRGHAVHLFTRTPPYLLLAAGHGISCHTLYDDKDISEHPAYLKTNWPVNELDSMAELIISVIKKQGLDILHMHYALPFIFIAQSIKEELREKAPSIILTLHGTDVTRLSDKSIGFPLSVKTFLCCDALTTVSASHAQLFTRLFPRHVRPEIITNFTDLSRFSRKEPHVANTKPVFLHISNFRTVKNPCGVVDIFGRFREKHEAELWFVGDGEEMENVKALVCKEGLTEDVRFFGLLPDISGTVNRADFLVMSSMYESFCITALEAMACGVPVIAPQVGGIPEVITPGKTGFLYPPGNYAVAAAFAARLLSEPDLYTRISMDSARRAQDFDQKQVITLYEELYSRVKHKALRVSNSVPFGQETTMHEAGL